MDNFNKFLRNSEVLILTIKQKKNKIKYYLILSYLILTFFLLYPLFNYGRRGVIIWIIVVIYILFLLAKELSNSRVYLLTNKRIIDLYSIYRDNYEEEGSVYIRNIRIIKKNKKNNIFLKVKRRKVYLINLEKRDIMYEKIIKVYKKTIRYEEEY